MKIIIGVLSFWVFSSFSHAAMVEVFHLHPTQEAAETGCDRVTELTLITGGIGSDKALLREKVVGLCDLYIKPDNRIYTIKSSLEGQKWKSNNVSEKQNSSLIIEITVSGVKTTEVTMGKTIIKYASGKPKALRPALSTGQFKLQSLPTDPCQYAANLIIDVDQKNRLFALVQTPVLCKAISERFYWIKEKEKTKFEGLRVEDNGARQLEISITDSGKIQSIREITLPDNKIKQWHVLSVNPK